MRGGNGEQSRASCETEYRRDWCGWAGTAIYRHAHVVWVAEPVSTKRDPYWLREREREKNNPPVAHLTQDGPRRES